jgi:hypothetical protein
LERLREELLQPLRTDPPHIGSYSREIDKELFQLFSDVPVVRREKLVTLGRQEVRPRHEVWVYETHGTTTTYRDDDEFIRSEPVTFGEVQEDGSFLPIPKLTEVPRYTENTDDAVDLKNKIIRYQRRVLIEEVEDEHISRWRAKIIDGSKQIVGEGETYSCGASIVLAILSDLIANDCASWWIEVVDEK